METEKQHYVPKVYLRFFTKKNDGHFFRAGPKPFRLQSIKPKHISEVCYLPNFYTLNKAETLERYALDDRNFIEKKAFDYEKKSIRQVINKLKQRTPYLNKSYHEQFVRTFLSIKHRNIFYRNHFTKSSIESLLGREIEKLQVHKEVIERVSGETFSSLTDRIKSNIANDLELHEEFHKHGIIEAINGTNEVLNDAQKLIMGLDIIVLEPLNSTDYFITSDNPGFTLLGNKVFNTNYGEFDQIGFPINSKQLVLFRGKSTQENLIIHKKLNHRKITSGEVLTLNYCTIFNAFQYVFCESKKYLNDLMIQFEKEHGSQHHL